MLKSTRPCASPVVAARVVRCIANLIFRQASHNTTSTCERLRRFAKLGLARAHHAHAGRTKQNGRLSGARSTNTPERQPAGEINNVSTP